MIHPSLACCFVEPSATKPRGVTGNRGVVCRESVYGDRGVSSVLAASLLCMMTLSSHAGWQADKRAGGRTSRNSGSELALLPHPPAPPSPDLSSLPCSCCLTSAFGATAGLLSHGNRGNQCSSIVGVYAHVMRIRCVCSLTQRNVVCRGRSRSATSEHLLIDRWRGTAPLFALKSTHRQGYVPH